MLQQKGIRPKKSLGQHFLNDRGAIRRIVDGLDLSPGDTILEIGCGRGALTRQLVDNVRQYVGIELDGTLILRLEKEFGDHHVVFLHQDVLDLHWDKLQKDYLAPGRRFKVVGNLPYYISTPIVSLLAQHASLLELAVIMLQAEVADRLTAAPGTKQYGVLTLHGQYYFDCESLFSVGPRAFRPPPEVASKVLRLTPKVNRPLASTLESGFLDFAKRCFSQRRKTLRNCLKGFQGVNEILQEFLKGRGYSPDVRPEGVSVEDFVGLYSALLPGGASEQPLTSRVDVSESEGPLDC
jgi:16S rRNA (adenine1518-N6/adenine1519-N6)-dimethyltransferase